jgi:predicted RNA-binding Zn-ribbon protein involved in translation (DUF1610 family)
MKLTKKIELLGKKINSLELVDPSVSEILSLMAEIINDYGEELRKAKVSVNQCGDCGESMIDRCDRCDKPFADNEEINCCISGHICMNCLGKAIRLGQEVDDEM